MDRMNSLISNQGRRRRCAWRSLRGLPLLLGMAVSLSACVSLPTTPVDGAPAPAAAAVPAPVPPVTPEQAARDREGQGILRRMGELRSGQPYLIGDVQVVAQEPYFAASGRFCRRVELRSKERPRKVRKRLACRQDGTWSFSSSVFAGW